MATVLDIAAYILHKQGRMTAMKLQKLCYYAQAWSLVWDEKPLFNDDIQAQANGPVAPRLYNAHRGRFEVSRRNISGKIRALTAQQRKTVNAVLRYYGGKSSQWLSALTHKEYPWKAARKGLNPGERGQATITHATLAEYYDSL